MLWSAVQLMEVDVGFGDGEEEEEEDGSHQARDIKKRNVLAIVAVPSNPNFWWPHPNIA